MSLYLKMFFSFFQIGLFSFGGGYVAVPLIQNLVIDKLNWLEMSEFINLITIAEMTPGPIVINAATFVGMRLSGFMGAVVCTLSCVVPSLIIVLLLSYLYAKYKNIMIVQKLLGRLRPVIVAMILSAGLGILVMAVFNSSSYKTIAVTNFRIIETILFVVSLYLLRRYKVNPIFIIFGSGIVGTLIYLII